MEDPNNYTYRSAPDDRSPPNPTFTHIMTSSAILVVLIMLTIVFGNIFVIAAVARDRHLRSPQNWFIASLAMSDILVGLFIMPLSLANELVGHWPFGAALCELWLATDVLLCTASILNLVVIALDRYWSITRATTYIRTTRFAATLIAAVWLLSVVICIPPLIGWKGTNQGLDIEDWFALSNNAIEFERFIEAYDTHGTMWRNQTQAKCKLSSEPGYVVYSTVGSFYIPLVVMVIVYLRIFLVTRQRARRGLDDVPLFWTGSKGQGCSGNARHSTMREECESEGGRRKKSGSKSSIEMMLVSHEISPLDQISSPNEISTPVQIFSPHKISAPNQIFNCSNYEIKCAEKVGIEVTNLSLINCDQRVEHHPALVSLENATKFDVSTAATRRLEAIKGPIMTLQCSERICCSHPSCFCSNCISTNSDPHETLLCKPTGECSNREFLTSDAVSCRRVQSHYSIFGGLLSSRCYQTVADERDNGQQVKGSVRRYGSVKDRRSLIRGESHYERRRLISACDSTHPKLTPKHFDPQVIPPPPISKIANLPQKDPAPRATKYVEACNCSLTDVERKARASKGSVALTQIDKLQQCRQYIAESDKINETTSGCDKASKQTEASQPRKSTYSRVSLLQREKEHRFVSKTKIYRENHDAAQDIESCARTQVCGLKDRRTNSSDALTKLRTARYLATNNLAIMGQVIMRRRGSGADRAADEKAQALQDPQLAKRKLARARERRAFLVLGIVMVTFVGCWLPFFSVYLVTSLAGARVPRLAFAIIFWLGYCNSALNPFIYTIFNRDFRRAFRRIICGNRR